MRKILYLLVLAMLPIGMKAQTAAVEQVQTMPTGSSYWVLDEGKLLPAWGPSYDYDSDEAVIRIIKDNLETTEIKIPSSGIQHLYVAGGESRVIGVRNSYLGYNGGWAFYFRKRLSDNEGGGCITGLMDESGKILCEFPDEFSDSYIYLGLSEYTGGNAYLVTSDDGTWAKLWKLNVTNGIVNPVAVRTATVSPNPVPSGSSVRITLEREADTGTVAVINNMNGRQVLRREVAPGENHITLSPRFAHGTYIYTVIYGDGTTSSGKIVAEGE